MNQDHKTRVEIKNALRKDSQAKGGEPVQTPQEQRHAAQPMTVLVEAKYIEPFDEDDHRPIDEARAKEIGLRLRELRKQYLDISSQEVFGAGIGVSRGAVANWEIGKGISRVNLYRIAEIYDVSMVWLSTGKGQPRGGSNKAHELPGIIEQSGLTEQEQDQFVDEVKAMLQVRVKHVTSRREGNGPVVNNNNK